MKYLKTFSCKKQRHFRRSKRHDPNRRSNLCRKELIQQSKHWRKIFLTVCSWFPQLAWGVMKSKDVFHCSPYPGLFCCGIQVLFIQRNEHEKEANIGVTLTFYLQCSEYYYYFCCYHHCGCYSDGKWISLLYLPRYLEDLRGKVSLHA